MARCAEAGHVAPVETDSEDLDHACVLIASHDQLLRLQLAAMLREKRYCVNEVESGLQILEHLGPRWRRVEKTGVLILDISHNPWVGIALLRAVFCEDWAMPIILIANDDERVRTEAGRLGVHTILTRPVNLEALQSTVAEIIKTVRQPTPDSPTRR